MNVQVGFRIATKTQPVSTRTENTCATAMKDLPGMERSARVRFVLGLQGFGMRLILKENICLVLLIIEIKSYCCIKGFVTLVSKSCVRLMHRLLLWNNSICYEVSRFIREFVNLDKYVLNNFFRSDKVGRCLKCSGIRLN